MPTLHKSGLAERAATRHTEQRLARTRLRLIRYLERLELDQLKAVVAAARTHFSEMPQGPGRPKKGI